MPFDISTIRGWLDVNLINIIITAVVIFVVWLTRRILLRYISRKVDDLETYRKWRRTSSIVAILIGAIAILTIWAQQFSVLIFFILVVILGLVISLKEPILNLAGWLYIIILHPFKIGDRVQVKEFRGYRGDILEVNPFSFKLSEIGNSANWVDEDESTGRIVDVPNGWVFIHPIANYSKMIEHIWEEIPIRISFDSNWQKAQKILLKILDNEKIKISDSGKRKIKKNYREYTGKYPDLEPKVNVKAVDFGMRLTIRYVCNTKNRRVTSQIVWDTILKEFSKHKDINLT
jgi:small-conductance mechanosensitive channel